MVEADPDTYSELRLGIPNASYRVSMENPFTWGGENEIILLSSKFGVETSVVSVESLRTLVYNAGVDGNRGRINLLYTGQHYDPLVLGEGTVTATEVRVMPVGDLPATSSFETEAVAIAKVVAEYIARRLKEVRKQMIKCGGCGALCDGSSAFQTHCMEVEHDDDFGYDCTEVEVTIAENGGDPVEVAAEDALLPERGSVR
jgi:ubiquitin thioesterase OTU1